MLNFSANLSTLFGDLPLIDRFAAAAAAGFRAVEIQFPYAEPPDRLATALARHNLRMVLFNLPAGDVAAGDLGLACDPGRGDEFRRGVARAADYARALDCPRVNAIVGRAPPGEPRPDWEANLIGNLRLAADLLAEMGTQLVIEPLNDRDHPGYAIPTLDRAASLAARAGGGIGLQFDLYHAAIMEPDWSEALDRHFSHIGHVQFSDHPGRGEPGTGTLDFDAFFAQLQQSGYAGWVGCEYWPRHARHYGWARRVAPYLG